MTFSERSEEKVYEGRAEGEGEIRANEGENLSKERYTRKAYNSNYFTI